MKDPLQLSQRERQIMEVIYRAGQASATDVVAAISDPPTRTSIRTLLRILEQKGHLVHSKVGREFIYRPTRPAQQVARSALRRLLDTFFSGSLDRAVAAYLADPGTAMSAAELKRLRDLIKDAETKGP